MNSTDKGPGKVFTECEDLIKANLVKCGFDPVILAETRGWSAKNAKKFVLKKDQCVYLPEGAKKIKMGLGWDTKMDLDSNIILVRADGTIFDRVWLSNKK
jgi:hypothetical protein